MQADAHLIYIWRPIVPTIDNPAQKKYHQIIKH
jgi:hypothetical protein